MNGRWVAVIIGTSSSQRRPVSTPLPILFEQRYVSISSIDLYNPSYEKPKSASSRGLLYNGLAVIFNISPFSQKCLVLLNRSKGQIIHKINGNFLVHFTAKIINIRLFHIFQFLCSFYTGKYLISLIFRE